MQQIIKSVIMLVLLSHFAEPVLAGPWFTGPLLAPAGHTIPAGHTNLEIYGFDVLADGAYTESGEFRPSPLFESLLFNPIMTHGFTDWLDVQFSLPYVYNKTLDRHNNRLADVSATLGLQLIEQQKTTWKPNLRLTIQETIPTGRFEHLRLENLGTDATGLGSYQTQIALNFQWLHEVFTSHYLRTRLSLSRFYASPVTVHGINSYGGALDTQGSLDAGGENDLDLAFEFTLTQNWVAVMEGYVSDGKATRFNGILTTAQIGGPAAQIGYGDYYEEALAPALEYNFNANVGLIGGVWFPLKSRNTSDYVAYVLALNAYW